MHNLIGVSLPAKVFSGKDESGTEHIDESFGSFPKFLLSLKEHGVNTIEIRAVEGKDKPDYVKSLYKALENAGFDTTIHGTLGSKGIKEDVLLPLTEILTYKRESPLIVTVHALKDKDKSLSVSADRTKKALYEICEYSEKKGLPIKICLELNREKGAGDPSVTCESTAHIVKSVGSDKLGICWDFGHYLYNCKMAGDEKNIPPKEFLELVAHTHIHALHNNVTHYPLVNANAPMLFEYVKALKTVGYSGIYNIELTLSYLIKGKHDLEKAYLGSVQALKEVLSK